MQRRAGSLHAARDLARIVREQIPDGARRFLAAQPFAVIAGRDEDGRVWASPLFGPPGFIRVVDPKRLWMAATPVPRDPLASGPTSARDLGVLVIDPRTRRRMRLNGRASFRPDGLLLDVIQAYGNCPKYIQRREPETPTTLPAVGEPRVGDRLDAEQQRFLERADTFFIASVAAAGGADASHRGGHPGFVRVTADDRLEFDDYPGNGMFNTLGNLRTDARAGLLFLDFENGALLQVTGRAEVDDDFVVRFRVESVQTTPHGSPLRFRFVEYSPVNPAIERRPGRQEESE